ncbi:MAG: glycosyltransferase family 39 protein [Verrucomicrobiia bacterium]|jgi:4-amino-4-deoxy-L-arabinose transferase-like glycosyltransferase
MSSKVEAAPATNPTWTRRTNYLLYGMLVIFVVWRLFYLHADPSGPYQNTDEQHHIADARKIVLYGTPFYDAYNPSVLMPLFTVYEVPFLEIFGVGHVGMRVGSICAVMGAAWLMSRLLQRRGERLAALLLMFWMGVSFFSFCHSRYGIQDPVMMFFSALTVYWFYRALETNRAGHYVVAFLSALAVPLTKTSGVFIYGMIGCCLLYKALTDRKAVNWKGVGVGAAASGVAFLLVVLFWFRPHWDEFVFLWGKEVAAKETPRVLDSIRRLIYTTVDLAPFITALCVAFVIRFLDRFLSKPRQCDNLDLILLSWLACAYAPMAYSVLWFPRWMMWIFLPLGIIGLRELAWLTARQGTGIQKALVGVSILGMVAGNWSFYTDYYRTMSFHMYRLVPFVEQMVGTNVVSGSGLQDLTYSSKLNIVWNYEHTDRSQDCDEIRETYLTPDKTPQYLGWHVSNDPSKFEEKLRAWYAVCPEWKKQYQPFMLNQRIDYAGACDIWLVRTNAPLGGQLRVITPRSFAGAN